MASKWNGIHDFVKYFNSFGSKGLEMVYDQLTTLKWKPSQIGFKRWEMKCTMEVSEFAPKHNLLEPSISCC